MDHILWDWIVVYKEWIVENKKVMIKLSSPSNYNK